MDSTDLQPIRNDHPEEARHVHVHEPASRPISNRAGTITGEREVIPTAKC